MSNQYLYLCRHGQSQFNLQGRLQGQMESPLTELGIQQAQLLAETSRHWRIKRVLSSPLSRARQTAQICADTLGLPLEVQIGLEERHYGHWQGLSIFQPCRTQQQHSVQRDFAQFAQRRYSEPSLIPCKGAESTSKVRQRLNKCLRFLAAGEAKGNILLVCHGDAIDALLTQWTSARQLCNGDFVRLEHQQGQFVWCTDE